MEINPNFVLIGAAIAAVFLFTRQPEQKQDAGIGGGYYTGSAAGDSGGSSAPLLTFSLPDANPNFPKSSAPNSAPDTSSKKYAAAAAASADINAQLYAATGQGDATRAEGNLLKFNIPRDSPTAYAVEKYTAKNYQNSLYQTTAGDIVFSKKEGSINLAQPAGNGLYTPAPKKDEGNGLYTPAPKKEIMSKK